MSGALDGLRVLDLTRVLAGPSCTQVLGDLGADVIKIERPGSGDDTRGWGPPFLKDADGTETEEAAYFLASNRNKRSLTLDIASPEGAEIVRRLAGECDVLVENFKTGNLARYGLGAADLAALYPRLVYCSVTGFGQTGPYSARPGYDFLAQGMGGIMSLTGDPDGDPVKVGVGIADMMCGMYAVVAILAALRHRDATGEGQHLDLALLDTQVAWLNFEAQNFLCSGALPTRWGNAHPNIVPYEAFPAKDGYVIVAAGNDRQFAAFARVAGHPEWAEDARFVRNTDRLRNRAALVEMIRKVTPTRSMADWLESLEAAGVPCGPVNTLDKVFDDPHVRARGMKIALEHPAAPGTASPFVASPIKMSKTPPHYRRPPPRLGEHSEEVLRDVLGLGDKEIASLRAKGVL